MPFCWMRLLLHSGRTRASRWSLGPYEVSASSPCPPICCLSPLAYSAPVPQVLCCSLAGCAAAPGPLHGLCPTHLIIVWLTLSPLLSLLRWNLFKESLDLLTPSLHSQVPLSLSCAVLQHLSPLNIVLHFHVHCVLALSFFRSVLSSTRTGISACFLDCCTSHAWNRINSSNFLSVN